MSISKGARVLSLLHPGECPGSYEYENSEGMRFYVLALDADENGANVKFGINSFEDESRSSQYLGNYIRQKHLVDALNWIGREPVAAACLGNPFLHIIASKNITGDKMSVALFNVFPDEIYHPVVNLDRTYNKIKFLNCQGELSGDKVTLKPISPYGIAAFEVSQ
jgi:hypothetical protein